MEKYIKRFKLENVLQGKLKKFIRTYKEIKYNFSKLTTVLTIVNMFGDENKNMDILILVVFIAITNFLLYIDTQNYKDIYLSLKKNYLDLAKLQIKIN